MTLALAKFNRIVKIDPLARTATVQCGVRNLAISEAVSSHGLYYAPDPSSQIACTIGGNVAENSGGVHCLKYGLTLHNVLTCTGFHRRGRGGGVRLRGAGRRRARPDLGIVVGSEGMLAVTTEVTVKLVPKPTPGPLHHGQLRRRAKGGQRGGQRSSRPASSRRAWR